MDNELDIIQLRLVIRGAVDCLSKDSIAINEALTAQGKAKLTTTILPLPTALCFPASSSLQKPQSITARPFTN